ncbi:MAG: DUF4296 domain-containing protein [Gracilimonas sp.]
MTTSYSKTILFRGIFFSLLLTIITACVGPEDIPEPKNLIAEDQYVDLLVEIQYIITYRNAYPDSVNADSLADLVYDKYGITEDQFMVSHEYYQKNVNEQIERIDDAIRKIREEEQYIQNRIDSVRKINARKDSISKVDTTLQNQPEINPNLDQQN